MSQSQSQQLDNPIATPSDTEHKAVERVMPAWDVIPVSSGAWQLTNAVVALRVCGRVS